MSVLFNQSDRSMFDSPGPLEDDVPTEEVAMPARLASAIRQREEQRSWGQTKARLLKAETETAHRATKHESELAKRLAEEVYKLVLQLRDLRRRLGIERRRPMGEVRSKWLRP